MSENFRFTITATAAALLAFSGSAMAQQHLDVQTTVQKQIVVQTEEGSTETQLVPADTVVPGDTVVYTITFENVGDEAADNVVITNPISDALAYVPGSATNGT